MALTHTPDTRNAIAAALAARVDIAGAGPNAYMEIVETGAPDKILATIQLEATAFLPPGDLTTPGDDAGNDGEIVFAGLPLEDPDAAVEGLADKFIVRDRDDNEAYRGTVGLPGSGADLELSNTTIKVLDAVRLNPGTGWRAPA